MNKKKAIDEEIYFSTPFQGITRYMDTTFKCFTKVLFLIVEFGF